MKVYELAKELGVQSKDLVAKIRGIGVQVANHMSPLEPADADRVRRVLVRERADTLEEVRLSATVIRRRSRSSVAPSPTAARAVERAQAAADAEQAGQQTIAQQIVEVAPPPPPPPPPVVETVVTAPEPVAPVRRAEPVVEEFRPPAPAPAHATPTTVSAAAAPTEVPTERTQDASGGVSAGMEAPENRPRAIPQSVVTGSAATGRFIQLPGAKENVPRVEIKDRDEELRRLGRAPAGRIPAQNRFGRPGGGGGGGGGFPGGRPGGPPRKRLPAAGKKLKQTQITTPAEHKRVVRMGETITVAELAQKMGVKGNEVVRRLWGLGMMGITINQNIDQDTSTLLANEFGYQIESRTFREEEALGVEEDEDPAGLEHRAPVVTIMGHVDHGKTSLLDSIRETNVVGGEAGGITQHIGAYKVKGKGGDVVFLDTPGHEAFTAMRARGAKMTDIVVLVVAADDGPMPQTIEAINHAKAADVPIVVAVNKVDKPDANPQAIRTRMMEYGLVPEELGGEHMFVDVSAKTKQGIDKLLEMLALQAEVLELKANPKKAARGHLVEARLDRNRGPISTVLVEDGTLRTGDLVVAGVYTGKIRAMLDDHGRQVAEAGPSTPVELLGLDGVPDAGDTFNVVAEERVAKQLVEHRRELKKNRASAAAAGRGVSLENIFDQIRDGSVKEVKIVLKADVQGSVEAVAAALEKLSTPTVGVKVISSGVGGITESDVTLAKASSAICLGFNVRPAGKAQQTAEQEGVEIKAYQVIYDAIDDVKKAMVGMLEPVQRERMLGKAEVRQIFSMPKVGNIAGCMVVDGKVTRRAHVRLVRDSVVINTGRLSSLKRFKDDVSEVDKGYECGLTIDGYQDLKEGDVIEAFEIEQIAATLDAPTADTRVQKQT